VNGADNAAYIKGDQSQELQNGGELRNRESLLGDIVNSSPIYVKDTETIFVGANDGMLHAFNALTGAERFAYVPAGINFTDLSSLSSSTYTHKYFVDGPVVVSTRKQTPNKNYLVGALGRGGKGVFGLDVTSPSTFSSGKVLWELTSGANLGHVIGDPLIVTLNGGNTKAVIFGNGINSATGSAVLFVVDLVTGTVLQQIDTGVTGDNALSDPRGWDNDGNGTVDYVYAGDLKGNLWKFDFTTGTGTIAHSGQPMFTTATGQPISTGLALARDPATGKRWVFAGTGRFMTGTDVLDNTVQSIYGVIDDDTQVTKADLQARDIVATATVNGSVQRAFEPVSTLAADKKGWYLDLDTPSAGERITSRPLVRGTVLVFASLIPPTDNTCDAGGRGFINAIDVFTGASLGAPYFDVNGDGKFDEGDKLTHGGGTVPVGSVDLGVGMPTLPTIIDNLLVVGGSKGTLGQTNTNPQGAGAQRISWREILRD
jgi:type IV pilus assembly protein PilY1